ncbi:ras association domain-containing protein 10 [Meleagris gallopavo]|uniref:ras association domain-containing protein 10 n=1 Tax=Meleagris gallopavo TaxID=9103 RepID=UPI0005499444|nr:ras association domain-containing protein 10 [Meleagris gallopavo]
MVEIGDWASPIQEYKVSIALVQDYSFGRRYFMGSGSPDDCRIVQTSTRRPRRVVRKAFRKLAKINKKRQQPLAREASSAERMETLVHLVLSQDHTIRQQIQRLRELDREIDRYEAKIHLDRMKRHGVNYVQDTYLVGAGSEEPGREAQPATGRPEDDYTRKCEEVLQLQEQRAQQEELLEHLAAEIQEELNERWMKRRRDELELAAGPGLAEADCHTTELSGGGGEGELQLEHERVKTQLSTSLYIGLKLSTDLEAVKSDLDCTQRAWEARERELEGNVALKRGCGVAIPQVKGNVTCFNHAAEESGKRMTMSAETTWRSPEGWIMFARRPSKWLVTMVPSGSLSFCISMQKYEYTCSKSD